MCLKVNRKIGALRRSFRQLCPVARRLFYLSIIQPDFDFGSSAFIPNILMSQRRRLVATWRRAVRAVAGSGYKEDVAPLLKELMIDHIEHRWAQHVAVTTFRCRRGTAPPDLRKKLKSVDHGRTTRGASGNFVPYRSSSTSGTVSFSNRAPLIGDLPNKMALELAGHDGMCVGWAGDRGPTSLRVLSSPILCDRDRRLWPKWKRK